VHGHGKKKYILIDKKEDHQPHREKDHPHIFRRAQPVSAGYPSGF
jgi:hypothetical protein